MDPVTIVLLILFFLLMEGFFSGSEIGVVSADRMKLRHLAGKGSKGAKLALEMLERPEWLLSTTLVGTNIAIVSNTTLATLLAVQTLGPDKGWVAVPVIAPIIWVFGEIVPKSIFQQRADVVTPKVIFILKGASFLFYPLLLIFSNLTRLVSLLTGGGHKETPFTLREEIELMLQMPTVEGDIHPDERSMIRRTFNFGEIRVRDIMVPLIDVTSIAVTANCGETRALARERAHPRMLVHQRRVDHVVGMVDALRLLGEPDHHPVKPFIQPVRFVPGSKSIEDLLYDFRKSGDRMVVGVDEFGACEGIVTLEDILERVVGDIQDEYDTREESRWQMRKVADHHYLLNPRMDLVTLKEKLDIALPDGNYETLGGFLLEQAEDIPKAGQVIRFAGFTFTVEKATATAIMEVRVEW